MTSNQTPQRLIAEAFLDIERKTADRFVKIIDEVRQAHTAIVQEQGCSGEEI